MQQRDLENLKNKINQSDVLSSSEKQEWLFLLPKMTDKQLSDLDRLVSIHLKTQEPQNLKTEEQKTSPIPKPISPISPIRPMHSLEKETEELKNQRTKEQKTSPKPKPATDDRLSLNELKKSPSVHAYLSDLKKEMGGRIASGKSSWKKELEDYEKSGLFRSYLKLGVVLLSGEKPEELDQAQFEALADFHGELKKKV